MGRALLYRRVSTDEQGLGLAAQSGAAAARRPRAAGGTPRRSPTRA